jgi:hypothetical protein
VAVHLGLTIAGAGTHAQENGGGGIGSAGSPHASREHATQGLVCNKGLVAPPRPGHLPGHGSDAVAFTTTTTWISMSDRSGEASPTRTPPAPSRQRGPVSGDLGESGTLRDRR